jgi:hypothetical protein
VYSASFAFAVPSTAAAAFASSFLALAAALGRKAKEAGDGQIVPVAKKQPVSSVWILALQAPAKGASRAKKK